MMDGATIDTLEAEVRAAADSYARALHMADGAALDALCAACFAMSCSEGGQIVTFDRATFIARVGGRDALDGAPDYAVSEVRIAGPEMAHVELEVAVPPRRFRDYLGFLKVDGEWRLATKLYRVVDGPAMVG
ncbi:hypothetical protein GLS40_12690 [Pseudooceanicola sp. 216_PA32_1]|jgi:hypothetical protein|uniref:Lumazine-binding n=1 Tax=Pseudooceanicola pacificus TaxID=2676438 RepID=A0A844WG96_9RHOB|nr:nuclear transport factor 2 family protein [Pseudooceanicola pacificus]MWB78889.1 hypothetical protein [Pseudooceanicola pacificus]